MLVTVVVVFNNLDIESNLFLNVGESGYANLSVDRGVGISAVVLGTIAIGWGVVGESHQRQQSQDKGLITEKSVSQIVIIIISDFTLTYCNCWHTIPQVFTNHNSLNMASVSSLIYYRIKSCTILGVAKTLGDNHFQ